MATEIDALQSHYPLDGMVLCCTLVDITPRIEIQKKCEEMGARHVLDLTSEVTHLICGGLFSPKYRYVARMRPDVKVVSTRWVGAMYEQWILGEDIDPRVFESEHRFPVLYRLRISVTGIADVAERKRIEEICHQEQASYHPDLTKDVTHLIAAAPTGKKYEFAQRNKITVVTPEWLAESIERGMVLEESFFHPTLAPEKIGVGARPAKQVVQSETVEFRGKRKIRKAAEEKLGGLSQSLWDDIIGQAANAKPAKRDEWEESVNHHENNKVSNRRDSGPKPVVPTAAKVPVNPEAMFGHACFWIWGFEEKQVAQLHDILLPHGGTIVKSLSDLELAEFTWRLVMVPRQTRIKDCPEIPQEENIVMVTEWWLESCLFYKKFIVPGDFTTTPLEEFKIAEMKGLDICITKFIGLDFLFYNRMINLVGANFHDVLNKSRHLLITNDSRESESEKIRYAHEHNIPVVTGEWLVECLKRNKKLSYEDYLIRPARKSLLGDRFKRKPEVELANGNKRLQIETEPVVSKSQKEEKVEGEPIAKPTAPPRPKEDRSGEGNVLDGCTVCVSDQLKNEDTANLIAIAKALGAMVIDKLDETTTVLTHLVHPDQSSAPSREYQIAVSLSSCSIVTPAWLHACNDARKHLDESQYRAAPSSNSTLPSSPRPAPHAASVPAPTTSGPLERKPSDLSGVSEILGKLEKEQLVAASTSNTHARKTRGRLQGKAAAGMQPRVFSRTPSGTIIMPPPGAATTTTTSITDSEASVEMGTGTGSTLPPMQQSQPLSQAIGYNSEETSMEKKLVRAKLDRSASEMETGEKGRRVQRPKGAVDLVPVVRRSGRKRDSAGGA